MQLPPTPAEAPLLRNATIEQWLAIPEERRAELIDGRIIYQGMPGLKHGRTQTKTSGILSPSFDRRRGDNKRPGGWWISQEVDMYIGGIGCRPDIVGWRRSARVTIPEPDERGVITDVPDWIGEVLSASTTHVDLGKKRVAYHSAGLPYYWLLDPVSRTLTVLERTDRDYLIILVAGDSEVVRAPPFDAIEIAVAELFGDEPESASAATAADAEGPIEPLSGHG